MPDSLPREYTEELLLLNEEEQFKAHLCFCYFDSSMSLNDYDKFLHPQEKKYYSGLKFEKRIKDYIMGRYAAKRSVALLAGEKNLERIEIKHGVFNHPVVKYACTNNIQVSISHCENICIAVAFNDECPIGVDVEKIDPKKVEVLDSQSFQQEKKLMEAHFLPLDKSLTILWTAKEALSKVLKTGLMAPFSIYSVCKVSIKGEGIFCCFDNFPQYTSVSFTVKEYVCSLVYPTKALAEINIQTMKKKMECLMKENNNGFTVV